MMNLSSRNSWVRCLSEFNVANPVSNVLGTSEGNYDFVLSSVVAYIAEGSIKPV